MTTPPDTTANAATSRPPARTLPKSSSVREGHGDLNRLRPGQNTSNMAHATPEPSSSVADLMTELVRATAAIGRAGKPTSPETDGITTRELLPLYRHECAVVRRLHRRHRQWRARTCTSDAQVKACHSGLAHMAHRDC